MTGIKHDKGKPRLSLLPWSALYSVCEVLEWGAREYGEYNWRDVEDGERRFADAALRHLAAHSEGHENDGKTGLPHLAHAACSVLFALWFAREKRGTE